MNTNATESSNFGEYPATSTKKVAQETFQTTTDAIPTSTEDLAQYDTTSHEVGLDSQFNLASNNEIQEDLNQPFTDFQTEKPKVISLLLKYYQLMIIPQIYK